MNGKRAELEGREFSTLDVRVVRSADGYVAVADSSYGGTYRGHFVNPVSAEDLSRFQTAMLAGATRDVGVVERAPTDAPEPAAALAGRLGGALFDAMFGGELLDGLRETSTLAQRDGTMLRIRLRLDAAPELASLPWELLRDATRDRYLCLSSRTQVVRHLGLPEPVRNLALDGALRVLVVVASPSDLPPLAVEAEWRALVAELETVGASGRVELRRVVPPTLDELGRALLVGPWHVFHFIGHGQASPPSLAFCDVDGRTHLVPADVLGITLADSVDLRLAILNACHTARASERDAFGGVAHELLHHSIPAAVAMQFAITDPAAIAFAGRLYTALSHGLAVDRAVGDARKTLYQRGAEWATPVIHLRGDGVVFESSPGVPDPEEVAPEAPTPPPRRGRRRIVVVAVVAVVAFVAVGAGAVWALSGRGDDDETPNDDTSESVTTADRSAIELPPGLTFEPTTEQSRICGPGGEIELSAGPADDDGSIVSVGLAVTARGLESETQFEPIRVVDDQGRPYDETDAGELNDGFTLDQDGTGFPQGLVAVRVNRDEPAHPGAIGIVLVLSGTCSDDPIYLAVAAPSP